MWAALIPWIQSLFASGTAAVPAVAEGAAPATLAGAAGSGGTTAAVAPKVAEQAVQKPAGVWSRMKTGFEDAMLGPEGAKLSPEERNRALWRARLSAISTGIRGGGMGGALQTGMQVGHQTTGEFTGLSERAAAEKKREEFETFMRGEYEKETDPDRKRALKIAEFTHAYSPPRSAAPRAPKTLDKPLGGNRYQREQWNPDTGELTPYGDPYEKKSGDAGWKPTPTQTAAYEDRIRNREWLVGVAREKPGEVAAFLKGGVFRNPMLDSQKAASAMKRLPTETDEDYGKFVASLQPGGESPAPGLPATDDADAPAPYVPTPDAQADIDAAVDEFEAKAGASAPEAPAPKKRWPERERVLPPVPGPQYGPANPLDNLGAWDKILLYGKNAGEPGAHAPGAWEKILMQEGMRRERAKASRSLGR